MEAVLVVIDGVRAREYVGFQCGVTRSGMQGCDASEWIRSPAVLAAGAAGYLTESASAATKGE